MDKIHGNIHGQNPRKYPRTKSTEISMDKIHGNIHGQNPRKYPRTKSTEISTNKIHGNIHGQNPRKYPRTKSTELSTDKIHGDIFRVFGGAALAWRAAAARKYSAVYFKDICECAFSTHSLLEHTYMCHWLIYTRTYALLDADKCILKRLPNMQGRPPGGPAPSLLEYRWMGSVLVLFLLHKFQP